MIPLIAISARLQSVTASQLSNFGTISKKVTSNFNLKNNILTKIFFKHIWFWSSKRET